jgi:CHAT domain-containing protein
MAQNRTLEAGNLVRDESNLFTGKETFLPYQEFIEQYEGSELQLDGPLYYKILTSKLFLAEAYGEEKLFDEGKQLVDEVKAIVLSSWQGPTAFSNPRLTILIENAEPYVTDIEDSPTKLAQALHVAEVAEKMGERHVQRAWLLAARRIVNYLAGEGRNLKRWPDFHRRYDELLRQVLDFEMKSGLGPVTMAATLMSVGFQMNQASRSSEWLEYVAQFRDLYPQFDIPLVAHQLYTNARTAARDLGDERLATIYSQEEEKFYRSSPQYRNLDSLGDYKFVDGEHYLYDWSLRPPGMTIESNIVERRLWLSCKFLCRWLSHDLEQSKVDEQMVKSLISSARDEMTGQSLITHTKLLNPSEMIAAVYGEKGNSRNSEQWNKWFTVVEPWLRRTDLPPSILHRHYLLHVIAWCRQMTMNLFHINSDVSGETGLEYLLERQRWRKEYQRINSSIDTRLDVTWQDDLQTKSDQATDLILLANHNIARERGIATLETLNQAIDIKRAVLERYKSTLHLMHQYRTQTSIARALTMKYRWFKACPANEPLEDLKQCDEVYRQMVSGHSNLPAFNSFWARHIKSEEVDHDMTLNLALKCSLEAYIDHIRANLTLAQQDFKSFASQDEYQKLVINLVDWSQKTKARSLSDSMGLGARYPEALVNRARNSDKAMNLMERFGDFSNKLQEALIVDQMKIRDDMRSLLREMRHVEELAPIINIYEGITIQHNELIEICADFEEDVFFIDWIHVEMSRPWNLTLGLYKNGLLFDVFTINTFTLEDIEDWVRNNLEPDGRIWNEQEDLKFSPLNDRTAPKRLNELKPLIEVIQHVIEPGQIIVICPTLALYRIPFHAIPCDGQILIERNPIVYCQSLTVLRLCLMARYRLDENVPEILRPAVFNPLSNEDATRESVSEIANLLGSTVQDASQLCKENFIQTISDASLIHFHGHVRFDEANPLSHHLELVPITESISSNNSITLSSDQILTAEDIFGITLQPGSHITTISCKSARAKISAANEQLGLLTAFHYAGASSAISTLWNIHRDDGARFAKAFYFSLIEDLLDESKENGKFANMARAMQRAVLVVRKNEKGVIQSPYHWAGFVFNGAWMFPRPRWVDETRSNPDVLDGKDVEAGVLGSMARRGTW